MSKDQGILKSAKKDKKRNNKSNRASAHFDEKNLKETLHPADKDYGFMVVDEPKTPYNFEYDPGQTSMGVDAKALSEKLQQAKGKSEEQKEFDNKRRKHYEEYKAVKLARKLMEQDEEEEKKQDPAKKK